MSKNPIIAPPNVGTGRLAGSSIVPCDKIDIDITKVEWIASYPRVLQKNTLIQPPLLGNTNTTAVDPDNFYYAGCSDKPAVYFIRSSGATAHKKIKLKITLQTKSACGSTLPLNATGKNTKLIIAFGQNRFTSNHFILPERGKEVTITLEGDLDHIAWLKSPSFSLQYNNGAILTKNSIISSTIILEAFVLYDEPASFYTQGVWVEALRFLFEKTNIAGDKNIKISANKITLFCNGQKLGMEYDTYWGGSYYTNGNSFYFLNYLSKRDIKSKSIPWYGKRVNCVDQGFAVRASCGALGLSTSVVKMIPFGYINIINLVGIGKTNNPFKDNAKDPTTGYNFSTDSVVNGTIDNSNPPRERSYFDMHFFARLTGTTNKILPLKNHKILDACAVPLKNPSIFSIKKYLKNSIDISADISKKKGITKITSSSLYGHEKVNTPEAVLGDIGNFSGSVFQTSNDNLTLIYE